MDPNKLTQKSQEAVQKAQAQVVEFQHQELDVEHLLLVLLDEEGGLVPRLLERLEADPQAVRQAVVAELQRRPRVGGPGAEAGKIFVSQRFQQLHLAAEKEAKRLKDE